jgi:putative FmdB family regulatory protein
MPYYDLRCNKCRKEFNIKASIQQRTDRQINCPACSSNELETIYHSVNIVHALNKDCDVCPGSTGMLPRGGYCGGNCPHG